LRTGQSMVPRGPRVPGAGANATETAAGAAARPGNVRAMIRPVLHKFNISAKVSP